MLKLLERECAKRILKTAMTDVAKSVHTNKTEPTEYEMYMAVLRRTSDLIVKKETKVRISSDSYRILLMYMNGSTQAQLGETFNRTQTKMSDRLNELRELLVLLQPRLHNRWPMFMAMQNCTSAPELRRILKRDELRAEEMLMALKLGNI